MAGIVSYGGYIPRLRLSRKSIYQSTGWLTPATISVAQGERSMCNWDEDSITMAVAASRDCLREQDRNKIDTVYLASTTLPFADRLNAGIVATALNLRANITAADYTSCLKAGTSALVSAIDAIGAGDKKQVLVTATDKREAKAASFQEMWFGDGAAALLLGSEGVIAECKGSYSLNYDFIDHYRAADRKYDYIWEERWIRDEGYLRIIPEAIDGLLGRVGMSIEEIDKLLFPCVFSRERAGIARAVGASLEQLGDNLHTVCGETGVAHPLVLLVEALERAKPGERLLVAGFGQGSDALLFEVTENILRLPARNGIRGSLANRKVVDNYFMFQSFRDLVVTDMGIRAEITPQTPMTTLWRNRKSILGLVGGKCQKCGTPQYPKTDICVNPECRAVQQQVDYEFANRVATVMTFTADMLAPSMDPPAIYGMVQFEHGGRLMVDFTDCSIADIEVGMPVKMSFRKHASDRERGFVGYFWKAIVQPREVRAETAEDGDCAASANPMRR